MAAFLPEHMEPHVPGMSTASVVLWVLLPGTLRRSCNPTSAWSYSRPFGASGNLCTRLCKIPWFISRIHFAELMNGISPDAVHWNFGCPGRFMNLLAYLNSFSSVVCIEGLTNARKDPNSTCSSFH